MVLNVMLLVIGFMTCGKEFGQKTVYTSVLLPVFLGLLEAVPEFRLHNGQPGAGCALLHSGGQHRPQHPLQPKRFFRRAGYRGEGDEQICTSSWAGPCPCRACARRFSAALGYDKKTVVLSLLGTYFNGIILDHFIFDHNKKRRVCIITEKEEALRQFIIQDLHSGATIYEAIGAYNFEKHNEIITIVNKSEYQKLMNFINREDPKAFITVYNVSDMRYQPKVWEGSKRKIRGSPPKNAYKRAQAPSAGMELVLL